MKPRSDKEIEAWRAHIIRAARRGCDLAVFAMHEELLTTRVPEPSKPMGLGRLKGKEQTITWWLVSHARDWRVMRTVEANPEASP